jgi:predicted metalloendopeptidase
MDSDLVSVSAVAYLVNVSLILQQTSPRTVQNYLTWRFMMNRASSMTREIRSSGDRFQRVFQGTSVEPSHTITCIQYVNDNMGFAVSRLYIQKYFDDNARNQVC